MRRTIALALSLLLVFTTLPMVALAVSAETVTITTEAELNTYLCNDTADTITFGSDITVTETIFMAKAKKDTVDMAGYSLIYQPADDTSTCMIQLATVSSNVNGLVLDLKNTASTASSFVNETTKPLFINYTSNSIVGSGNCLRLNSGLFEGDILAERALMIGVGNQAAYPTINGNITITNNTTKVSGTSVMYFEGVINGDIKADAFTNLSNTSIHASSVNKINGNITSETGSIQINRSKKLTIVGEITAATSILIAGVVQSGGNITAGTTVVLRNFDANILTTISGNITAGAEINIKNGTYNGTISSNGGAISGGVFNDTYTTTAKTYIFGGAFVNDPTNVENSFIKGVFSLNEETGMYEDYYEPVELNGTTYATFNDALAVAVPGDTIKLIDDYYTCPYGSYLLSLKKDDITVDLNGHLVSDVSDLINTDIITNFVGQAADIKNFKVTSSNGQGKIVLNSCDGASQQAIKFTMFNNNNPTNLTFENFEIVVTGGEGNNRGFMYFAGTSTLDNEVSFNNVKMDWLGNTTVAGIGINGIEAAAFATYNITDCDLFSNRYLFKINTSPSTFNFTRTNLDAGKGNIIYIDTVGAKLNFDDCDIAIAKKNSTQSLKFMTFIRNTVRPQVSIKNSSIAARNDSITLFNCAATTNYVGADVTIENSTIIGSNTAAILPTGLSGAGSADVYKIINSTVTSGVATAGGAITTAYGSKVELVNSIVNYAEGITSSSYPISLAGTSKIDLNDSSINGGRYAIGAANTCAIGIDGLSLNKNNTDCAFAANIATAGVITLADGCGIYEDAEGTTPVADGFVWNTTKTYTDLYVVNTEYNNVYVDGVKNAVAKGGTFTLPESTMTDRYFAGYSDGTTLYSAGDEVEANSTIVCNSMGVRASMVKGAAMRFNDPSGIRFLSKYNKVDIDNIEALTNGKVVNRITDFHNNEDVHAQTNADGWYKADTTSYYVAGSIAKVQENHANYEFSAAGKLSFGNGTVISLTENENTRTIAYIATQVLNGYEYAGLSDANKAVVDKWAAMYIA